jgi:hypothetical protein
MLASIGAYACILLFGVRSPPGTELNPTLLYAFIGTAVMCAVMSFIIPNKAYRQTASQAKVETVEEAAPEVFSSGYRDATPLRKVFANPTAARRTAAMCFQPSFVLSLALSEAVALFGFILGFLGFGAHIWAPFMAFGAILIMLRFPTEQKVAGLFEQTVGATFPPEQY